MTPKTPGWFAEQATQSLRVQDQLRTGQSLVISGENFRIWPGVFEGRARRNFYSQPSQLWFRKTIWWWCFYLRMSTSYSISIRFLTNFPTLSTGLPISRLQRLRSRNARHATSPPLFGWILKCVWHDSITRNKSMIVDGNVYKDDKIKTNFDQHMSCTFLSKFLVRANLPPFCFDTKLGPAYKFVYWIERKKFF